jgi:hypothetical protein
MHKRLEHALLAGTEIPQDAARIIASQLTWNQVFGLLAASKKLMTAFWNASFEEALSAMTFVSKLIKQHIQIDGVAGKIKGLELDVDHSPNPTDDNTVGGDTGFHFGVPTKCIPLPSYMDNIPGYSSAGITIPAPAQCDALPLCDWNIDSVVINKLPKPFVIPGRQVVTKWTNQFSRPHEVIDSGGYVLVKQLSMDTLNLVPSHLLSEKEVSASSQLDYTQWLLVCANDDIALWIPKTNIRVLDLSGDLVMISFRANDRPYQSATCEQLGIPSSWALENTAIIIPVEKLMTVNLWDSTADPSYNSGRLVVAPSSAEVSSARRRDVTKRVLEDHEPLVFQAPFVVDDVGVSQGQWQMILALIVLLFASWAMAVLNQ